MDGSLGAAISKAGDEDPVMGSGVARRVEGMRGVTGSSHSKRKQWPHLPHAPKSSVKDQNGCPLDSASRRLFRAQQSSFSAVV